MLATLFWFVACGEGDALRSSDAAQTLGDAPQARILEILDRSVKLPAHSSAIVALIVAFSFSKHNQPLRWPNVS